MNNKSLIEKVGFCSIRERYFEFDNDIKLKFYCCKKTDNIKCQNICDNCNEIYARYVIVDLRDVETKQICDKFIFSSKENFNQFQEDYLSEIFFYENNNVRYNIYLIFICDNKENINRYIDYSYEINFARKLFFTPDEFKEYFRYYDIIIKQSEELKYSMDQEIISELEKVVQRLDSKGMKSVLLGNDNIFSYIFSTNSAQRNYDHICGVKENYKSFLDEYVYKKDTHRNQSVKNIKYVKKILLNNFRENCFGECKELEFGRVNIICGINTGGKTSLLDAIEFGLTGSMHKYNDEDFAQEAKVVIEGENGQIFSSEESNKNSSVLKNIWYPYKIGTLEELFSRVNYFDTDAAYKFALEQGDEKETYKHIKALLSTSKLIDFEENLNENLAEIGKMKFLVENNQDILRSIVKRKRTTNNKKTGILGSVIKLGCNDQDLYEIDNKKIDFIKNAVNEFEKECMDALQKIKELMNNQAVANLKVLNIIFHRLHSSNCEVIWRDGAFKMKSPEHSDLVTIDRMSTAQKVCLALSVIFTQFILASDAPKIILLDESVVNFDAFHLLNLFDFLRELTLHGVQIFFTTASEEVAKVAKSKLGFLNEQCCIYKIEKNPGETSQIIKI